MDRRLSSYIFQQLAQGLFFLINVFALYLMLRGHNFPGGGFIGGLATAISFILLSLAIGMDQLDRYLRIDPLRLAAAGLALAALTSAAPLLVGRPFLEHAHVHLHNVPLLGDLHVGTPLLFDGGVYLVVVGITCKIILALGRSTLQLGALSEPERLRYSSPLEQPIEQARADGGPSDAA